MFSLLNKGIEHWEELVVIRYQWVAGTETVARNVGKYFLGKGMKGAPGGDGRADYMYIFYVHFSAR